MNWKGWLAAVDWIPSQNNIIYVVFCLSEVRAPIPQKQDILVEPEPLFGGITGLPFFFNFMQTDVLLNCFFSCAVSVICWNWLLLCLLHVQCQSEEDLLDPYLMVSETSKQKQVSTF